MGEHAQATSSATPSTQHARMRSSNNSILPHISEPSYTSLDGKGRQQMRGYPWKKIAIGAGLLLALIWLFSPGSSSANDGSFGLPPLDNDVEDSRPPVHNPLPPIDLPPTHHDDDLPVKKPPPPPTDNKPASGLGKHPTSSETDLDPSSTTYCSAPYTPGTRLVQYALMIDAGSQGSRIHVYKFNHCKPTLALEYEVFVQTRPGLSAYGDSPIAAAESLDVLMDAAVKAVPASLVGCTPVAVKATAGLRLLGEESSAKILAAVRHRLSAKYGFELPSTSADGMEDRVAIMDGKDEGVYAWITSNYLLGTIGPGTPVGTHTYAVLDLGGASTQIVFEPTFPPHLHETFLDGEHKYSLAFGGKQYTLYQHSYLGYGLMRARASVHSLVAYMGDMQAANHHSTVTDDITLVNPCISQGASRKVLVEGNPDRNITMTGLDVATYAGCTKFLSLVLAKDSLCSVKPCSFDGAYQPSIIDTFPSGGILALSYFTDRLQPFVQAGLVGSAATNGHTMPISEISLLAQRVCLGKDSWKQHFATSQVVMEELETRPEMCLDLTFMHSLLRLGYEFSDEREVRLEKKIDGIELGWALGAALALLDGQLSCKA